MKGVKSWPGTFGDIVARRKPLIKIDPVADDRFSVWEDREQYIARKGRLKEEFDVPPRSNEVHTSPLED